MSFKSNDTHSTSTQSSTTTPWAPQAQYLTQAFQGASNALNQAQGAQAPTNYTATFTPEQINDFENMLGYGMASNPAVTNANNAALSLTPTGISASSGGLNALSGFTPENQVTNNIDAANRYVAGQDIPAQVDAALADARRQASEQTLPALARAAAGSGNINSSRTAIQQGIVQRGLAEKGADLSAQLRANAFNNGLQLGQQGNNNALQAAMDRVLGGNSAVGAGVNAGTSAINNQSGLFNIANTAIANQHTAAQAPLTNEQQQYQAAVNNPFAALMNFYNIIGNRPWGATTVGNAQSDTQQTPSTFSSIIGGIGAIGSLIP